MLDVVKLGEEALLFGRAEILELLKSLPAQVAAVYEEQHSASARILDEPVDEIASGEGLSSTRGHLN